MEAPKIPNSIKKHGEANFDEVTKKIRKNIDEEIRDLDSLGMDMELDNMGKESSHSRAAIDEIERELEKKKMLKDNLEDESYHSLN